MLARDILAKVPFFVRVLDDKQLDALAAGAKRAERDSGSVLVRQGAEGDSLFVIAAGKAAVVIAGRPQVVATLGPGDIVGEMSLLTGARRSATVTAIRPLVVYEIACSSLKPILAGSPALYEGFAAMVTDRQAELDRAHGPGIWTLVTVPRDQLAAAIRSFLGNTH